ncbi:MAG: ATP-binding protein [Flavobacteriales bacterium]|tara:strand:+ start:95 stop:1087 length:993 start_codon:yes stop_codon:yes gene_type:complete
MNNSPLKISFIIAGISILLFWGFTSLLNTNISFVYYSILFVLILCSAFLLIKNYIQKKINLLYRTIHTQKILNEPIYDLDKVEKEVQQWVKEKQIEIEHLKDTEKFRREFIGNVSHELKTPIFNIQGYVLTLLEGALEDEQINRKYLQRTQKSVERMITIVEDLSNISNMESSPETLKTKKFDIVSCALSVLESLEYKAKKSDITLRFDKEYDPIFVEANESKISQVFVNLVNNSIVYGRDNGVTKIKIFDLETEVLIEVSDNGIGIEEEDISRLCERFYRVDSARSIDKGGTGLGLSIVKHIIESHQQTFNIRSTVGVGSTFSFTLQKY